MKLNETAIEKRLTDRAVMLVNGTKAWMRTNAYITGDMESAVTRTNVKRTSTGFEIEVFVDRTQLGNKRGNVDTKYPIYVSKGHKTRSKGKGKRFVKGRPFFQIVLNQQRNKYPKLYGGITND